MTPEQIGLRYVMRQESEYRLTQVLQVHMGDGTWVDVPSATVDVAPVASADPGFTPQ